MSKHFICQAMDNMLHLIFQLFPGASSTLLVFFYSNDGDQDIISFFLDNDRFGEVTTHPKSGGGHLWNVIENSGLVGNTQTLVPGEHMLTIRASNTDEHGVELDALKISFTMCEGKCPVITPLHRPDEQDSSTDDKSTERSLDSGSENDNGSEDDSSYITNNTWNSCCSSYSFNSCRGCIIYQKCYNNNNNRY